MLGKLEEEVLLATAQASAGSKGSALPSQVYSQMVRSLSDHAKLPGFGAVFTTLNRMAAKGLVTLSDKIDDSGRERRGFSVSPEGSLALRGSMSRLRSLGAVNWLEG